MYQDKLWTHDEWKNTSYIYFSYRPNEILAIDESLKDYEEIPADQHERRLNALLAIQKNIYRLVEIQNLGVNFL